jgi:tetratricopeptide (TPR) repeat protein
MRFVKPYIRSKSYLKKKRIIRIYIGSLIILSIIVVYFIVNKNKSNSTPNTETTKVIKSEPEKRGKNKKPNEPKQTPPKVSKRENTNEKKKDSVGIYLNRGIEQYKKGYYDQAIANYTRAIEINPKFDVAYYNRGSTYYKKGDHHRGIYDLQMACKLGNKNACEFLERIKSQLESDINNALRNSGLKRITAEVNDSLEVTLKGSAESISEKYRAFEMVNKFVEIKRVVDKIFVVESK